MFFYFSFLHYAFIKAPMTYQLHTNGLSFSGFLFPRYVLVLSCYTLFPPPFLFHHNVSLRIINGVFTLHNHITIYMIICTHREFTSLALELHIYLYQGRDSCLMGVDINAIATSGRGVGLSAYHKALFLLQGTQVQG